ncbi:hypothetical protein ACKGJN_15290 [Gillisia sp. Q332]|uniref:hypothetical protein n=1 Tax=Gillisia xinjiangensis TaxID=3384765 RepID=UPI00391DE4F1
MKLFLTVLTMIFIVSSCKNDTEKDVRNQEVYLEEENSETENKNRENQNIATSKQKDSSELKSQKQDSNSKNNSTATLAGNYIKAGLENDANCTCYCLDVQFNSTSQLCLTPDKMYINVRFEKVNEKLGNVYLIAPSDRNTEGDAIPWSKFSRNIPVATITSQNIGEIDFDWLGFTINGDIAKDYALFGKKTLEGNYIKK